MIFLLFPIRQALPSNIYNQCYFTSGFHTILPSLTITLGIPPELRTWPSSVLSLVAGAFFLPAGRLLDLFSPFVVYNAGWVIFSSTSLACGFAPSPLWLIIFRALKGLGSATLMPAGIALIGRTYRPGPRKNRIFGLYGAFAVLGLYLGTVMGGLMDEFSSWRTYFWIGTGLSILGSVSSLLAVPRETADEMRIRKERDSGMDWLGIVTLVPGLCLTVFAITDSSNAAQGWRSVHILVALIFGLIFLGTTAYVEAWISKYPLIPKEIFKVRGMKRLLLALFIDYGVLGLFVFYTNF